MEFSDKFESGLLSLYALQAEYFNHHKPAQKTFKPFIGKIIIENDMKKDIAQTLMSYGIYKSTFYPELMNIGQDITKRIFP